MHRSAIMRGLRFLPGFLVSCGILIALLFASCSKHESPVAAASRQGTLIIGNAAEPTDLDPQVVTVLSDQNIMLALFEGLTALDEETTEPVPAAAERWEATPDGLTWTFHLRAGLQWSNGEPLTADDFVQSFRRVLNPAFASENAWYLYALKNAEAYNTRQLADPAALGLAAPDAQTLVLALERPTPYLPALVSMPAWFPVNTRVIAKFGGLDKRGTKWTRPENHVGNGPFKLKEWTLNSRIVAEKNPHFHDAAHTQLSQLVFLPIEKPDDEERSFRAGQLHVTFTLPVSKIGPWKTNDPAKLRLDPMLQTNFLRINTTQGPLADARVRRALALAIDREALAASVLQGSRQPAHSLTPPHTGGYTSRATVDQNLEQARQLLAASGFAGGKGLPTFDLLVKNDELSPRIAEALQAMWQSQLGVATAISQTEQKTWIQNQQTLNYSLCLSAWTADFPDPVTFLGLFTSNSAYNWTGWKNPAYDRLMDEAARIPDAAQRSELFQPAEKLLLDDSAAVPVFYGAQPYLIDPAVKGWRPAPLVFRRYQQVSLQP